MSETVAHANSVAEDVAALIASVAEPTRFGDLFERHVVAIYRYFSRRTGPDSADDLTAATFSDAFRNRHRYDATRATPKAWLFGIATTHVLHHRRDEARRLAAHARLSPDVEPEAATEVLIRTLDDSARLDAALSLIGAELRDVVMLTAAAELTYEECASALDIPIGTVRSRLSRARRELRGLLEDPPIPLDLQSIAEGNAR